MSEWISVEDELPEGDCLVFVEKASHDSCRYHVASYHRNISIIGNHFHFDMPTVTHWKPLPLPPLDPCKNGTN